MPLNSIGSSGGGGGSTADQGAPNAGGVLAWPVTDAEVLAAIVSTQEGDTSFSTRDIGVEATRALPGANVGADATSNLVLVGSVDAGGIARRLLVGAHGGLGIEGVASGVPVATTDTGIAAGGIIGGWTPMGPTAMAVGGIAVKGSPGLFGSCSAFNGTPGAGFLQVHNLAAATGLSTATIVATSTTTATSGLGVPTIPNGGIVCSIGIVIAWSTAQYTYAAPLSNVGSAIAAYK